MKNTLHELATTVGFEVVNVDEGYINYEFNKKVSGIESFSHIIKVEDNANDERMLLTFNAIISVLPKKIKNRIYKLIKKTDITKNPEGLELVLFAVDEYKSKCDYNKLKEYGSLLGVDIEKLGYAFTYELSKKDYLTIISIIERAVPMEYAPELGKIKKIDYKIGYIKNNKLCQQKIF